MSRLLVCLAVLVVLAGCGGGGDTSPAARVDVPGLTAPEGQGLVGGATGALEPAPPTSAPVGAQVPAIGTCIGTRVGYEVYQYERTVGDQVDCATDHQGVVVGVEGFDPAALQQPGGYTGTTLDDLDEGDVYRVTLLALPGCRTQIDAVAAHALSLGGDLRRVWSLDPEVRLPTQAQWEAGERWAACLLYAPDLAPIAGGVDVLALSAQDPLPPSLQRCTTSVGDAYGCTPGAARQSFLDLPITPAQTPESNAPFTDQAEGELRTACRAVLARVDPDLADADWLRVSVDTRRDPLDRSAETAEDAVGARCSLVNRNFGAGLDGFLP